MSLDRDDMRPCAGCGKPCDGDVCDYHCEVLASDRERWRGKEPCSDCLEESRNTREVEPATEGDYCSSHAERRNEAAAERQVESFYGG